MKEIDLNSISPAPEWAWGKEEIVEVKAYENRGRIVIEIRGSLGGVIRRGYRRAFSAYLALRRLARAAGYEPARGEAASVIAEAVKGRVLSENPWPRD